jgi:hypothetical protein
VSPEVHLGHSMREAEPLAQLGQQFLDLTSPVELQGVLVAVSDALLGVKASAAENFC